LLLLLLLPLLLRYYLPWATHVLKVRRHLESWCGSRHAPGGEEVLRLGSRSQPDRSLTQQPRVVEINRINKSDDDVKTVVMREVDRGK